MIRIHFSGNFAGGGLFWAEAPTFEHSSFLGKNGWTFYGSKTNRELGGKLKDAGVPLNSRWLPISRRAVAAQLVGVENVEFLPDALSAVAEVAAIQTASRDADATNATVGLVAPEGLEYRPYQIAGVKYAMQAFVRGQKGVLIGDEMGLGKTIQAIGVMAWGQPKSTLVVCPASLKANWSREIAKWTGRDAIVVDDADRLADIAGNGGIAIINYDRVSGPAKSAKAMRAALASAKWDLLVCDEAHVLKNEDAQRTRVFFGEYNREGLETPGVVHNSDRVLLLSGTPIQNKVRESIPLFRAIGAFEGPNAIAQHVGSFLYRYCGPQTVNIGRRTVKTFDGATHLDELQAKLRAGWMIRRLKAQVATELPPKIRSIVTLPHVAVDGFEDIENLSFGENLSWDEAHKLIGEAVSFERLSAYRAALAEAKAEEVCDFVRDLIESNGKVIVFAHHKAMIASLSAEFGGRSIVIDGSVDADKRQPLVDRFQTDDDCRVAILSTHAAGVGLTLTAASCVVFAEADWNPSWCVQAEDRAHRIGQTADAVTVHYLVCDGTVDARVIQFMTRKLDIADRALDRKIETAAPAPVVAPVAAPVSGTHTVETKKGIVTITDDQIAAVAEGLLFLAGQCDGAREQDDAGFNGMDTPKRNEFTASLLARIQAGRALSPKQAAAARVMLRKYTGRQLAHLKARLF